MFKKLLSNLPFNPSLIGQVSFYAKRMHNEAAVRRMGFVMLILAMFIQIFSVVSPPEPTLASSGNDIIQGGFANRDQAVLHCLNSQIDFNKILAYYGITCDILASAETVTIRSTDYDRKLDSMGRWAQGPTITRTGKLTDEYPVSISGTTYYMRNLWAWDSGAYSSYQVLRMRNPQGVTVMILFNCGNIVTIDRYTPPAPPNNPPTSELQVVACDARNRRGHFGGYAFDTDRPSQSLTVTLFIDGVRVGDFPANVARPDVNSYFKVTGNHGFDINLSGHSSTYDGKVHSVYATAAGINAAGQPDGNNKRSNTKQFGPCTVATATPPPSTPPPPAPEQPTAPNLELSKKARNVTKNIADANNTQAAPGDTIQYILSVKNTGTAKADDFEIVENLADVLEYADIVSLNGATLGEDKVARWPKIDISAGTTASRELTVKVKSTVPSTPVSSSHQGSYDLTMTNVYGNAINISLPAPTVKQVEQVVTTLPNTGPGESMAAAFTLVVVVGYFFARSRLLAKEYDLVRTDFGSYGGTA